MGPAVIAGHVDSTSGPAVFFRLRDLRVGDLITVRRQDRSVVRFEIDDVHAYPKNQFPTGRGLRADRGAGAAADHLHRRLRCPGRSYLQNLVVSSHLI